MREKAMKKEKVKTITVGKVWFEPETFDEEVEKFIRTVDVLAIEYSCSVDNVNGMMITTKSAMIIYRDKEAEQE